MTLSVDDHTSADVMACFRRVAFELDNLSGSISMADQFLLLTARNAIEEILTAGGD